jgi:uncharacterized phage-associated protein
MNTEFTGVMTTSKSKHLGEHMSGRTGDKVGVDFPFDVNRGLEAVVYLASRDIPALDKYKLAKLLFLADKYHLVKYGRPITGDQYFAMPHGPVPTTILNLLSGVVEKKNSDKRVATLLAALEVDRSYQYPRFKAKQPPEQRFLSTSDLRALDEIVERFGNMTFAALKAVTHEMVAYQKAWERRKKASSVPMAFEDFFEEDSDAVSGAREEMIENYKLRKAITGR